MSASAAFLFFAAGAVAGDVTVTNLDPADPQGDELFIALLEGLGATVSRTDGAVRVAKGPLRAAEVNLADAPDLFPIAAVLATQCADTTRLYGAPHLQVQGERPDSNNRTVFMGHGCRNHRDR